MIVWRRSVALVGALLGFGACTTTTTGTGTGTGTGTARVALDGEALCDRYVNTCGGAEVPYNECVDTYTLLRVAPACVDAMNALTCEELLSDSESSADAVCSPPCSTEGSQSCNGDGTISMCVRSKSSGDLRTLTVDCSALCAANTLTFSGICGTTYEGVTDEKQKCWCK